MTKTQYDISAFLETWASSTWEMNDLQTVFCAGPDLVLIGFYAPETGTRVAIPIVPDQARQLARALGKTADDSEQISRNAGVQ